MAPRSAPPLGPRKHVRRSLIVSPGFQLRALLPLLTFLVLAAALLAEFGESQQNEDLASS